MHKFRFSPSILDKMEKVLEAEQEFESDYNYTDEGGYKATLSEIQEAREKELIDALNYVPQPPSIAAARGTAFNECVDVQVYALHGHEVSNTNSKVRIRAWEDDVVVAECDGFEFKFDRGLINETALRVEDATMQMHIYAMLDEGNYNVLLHGYPDYILPTSVVDLKTTESYTWGKYGNYWQRYAYPWMLMRSGLMDHIESFEFLVAELKTDRKTGLISGTLYQESYTDIDSMKCEEELKWICTVLCKFIEDHRDKITNPEVFR